MGMLFLQSEAIVSFADTTTKLPVEGIIGEDESIKQLKEDKNQKGPIENTKELPKLNEESSVDWLLSSLGAILIVFSIIVFRRNKGDSYEEN